MNLNETEKNKHEKKASGDNYYPTEKSHWEEYQLYYLVFGSFFFTVLIIFISNSSINSRIDKINKQLNNPSELLKSWMQNSHGNRDFPKPFSPPEDDDHHQPDRHGYESGNFTAPSEEQKNENWLTETVFQNDVREEFKIWVNSVKYLPRYRIGGQAEPEQHALFYGPPGSGKSYLAEMFAVNESLRYISAKFGTEQFSGSSQIKVNKVMKQARKLLKNSRGDKPVVIIIDEMDSVGVKDSHGGHGGGTQEVNAILTMIDDIKRDKLNIIVIGITNYPDVLDPALKRAGRLGRQIEIPFLTKEEIKKMVDYLEKDMKKDRAGSLKSENNKPKWEKEQEKESFIEWTNDFWSQVNEITQEAFEKCRQNEVGITYTDLELSIKDSIAKEVSKDSKKVTPQTSDFKKELTKKVEDKIRGKPKPERRRRRYLPTPAPEREDEDNY